MNNFHKGLIVAALCVVGIWGCAQSQPGAAGGSAERIKALEMKTAKLEDDFRTLVAARDQLRKKLSAAEDQEQELRRQLAAAERVAEQLRHEADERMSAVNRDRDDLRAQLESRTAERDALQGQFEQFRNTIRDLIGQTEAALPATGHPLTRTEATKAGKS